MGWIRYAVVDIVVSVLVVLATFGGLTWAVWPVWIYTPFILLLRVGSLGARIPQKKTPVPETLYHALYAVNTVVPIVYAWRGGDTNWYWVGAAWVVVWALSVYSTSRRASAK